jgi:hypothetical protein
LGHVIVRRFFVRQVPSFLARRFFVPAELVR